MGFCRDLFNRDLVHCPTCHGSGWQPSVAISAGSKCIDCRGGGYFTVGVRTRLATLQEWQARQ
jgi:DnaJ-class molecular chaperone